MNVQSLIGSGVSSLLALVVGVLVLAVILGVAGTVVVIVVANRAEPDPSGRRPFVVYLFGVAFFTIWIALIGSVAVVSSPVQLIGSHPEVYSGSIHPIGDMAARGAVLGGLVFLISLSMFLVHLCKGSALANGNGQTSSPAQRSA